MTRMPAVFVGHGNPMNAIESNEFTRAWDRWAANLPRPRAILSVSAHWYGAGGRVTANERPPTIHDFGGFPRRLFEVEYPAPGSPDLAGRVRDLLAPAPIALDDRWGLDHGTWSVLVHLAPDADVPVVQLGIDETLAARDHYELARRLRPLRDEGVLVLGSGNVVHNLHAYAWGQRPVDPYDWAVRFESWVRDRLGARDRPAASAPRAASGALVARDLAALAHYEDYAPDAARSVPTPEHYLPLLYVVAQHRDDEPISIAVEGFDGGSVSMLAVQIG